MRSTPALFLKVPVSNLGPEISYPDGDCMWFSSFFPGKRQEPQIF
jgi:hypothetical protein